MVLEDGLADRYMPRRHLDVLSGLGDVEEVRSIGGAAKSRLWNRIEAAVLQKRIQVRLEPLSRLA